MHTPSETKELEAGIIALCEEHRNQDWQSRENRRCITAIDSQYVVKYGYPDELEPEAWTQLYIYGYAQRGVHSSFGSG